ncbi:MAG TPA: hypothetical protein VFB37_13900 [Steroidobacteraceae bacterium]|nr:hypothetical protein [Steroidobacteraceae bacterium]
MEFLLLWWDELDDLTHACRHLATCALTEVAGSAPLIQGALALSSWMLLHLLKPSPLNFS